MTLFLTVVPAIVASAIKRRGFKPFVHHLPIIQLKTHYKNLKDITRNQEVMLQYHDKLFDLNVRKATFNAYHVLEKIEGDIQGYQKKLEECQRDTEAIKTEFQSFKIYAGMLESAPQVILQFSILLKKLYFEDFSDLFDPITWLQISSSLISVILTTSGLIAEMPFLVGKETRVPFRDLYFTYGKIVPLMSLVVTPRLFSVAASFSFATLEDAPFYVTFVLMYLVIYSLAYGFGPVKWVWKKRPENGLGQKDFKELLYLGFLTSLVSPCIIGTFKSNFLAYTSILTAILQSSGLTILWLISWYQPGLIFNSSGRNQDYYLKHFCQVTVPLLFLSCLALYLIQKLVYQNNIFYKSTYAIDFNDVKLLQKLLDDKKKIAFNAVIPDDPSRRSLFTYALTESDECGALLIKHSDHLGFDVNQRHIDVKRIHKTTVTEPKTPLMICCQLGHVNSVKEIFKLSQKEAFDIPLNCVDRILKNRYTAFHYACLSKAKMEAKKQIIEEFWIQAKEIKIDLTILDNANKTGFDILIENPQTEQWVEEFSNKHGSPIGELQGLKHSVREHNFDMFKKLVKNITFSITPELLLFYCIESRNEKFAIHLIELNDEMNLQLEFKTNDAFAKTVLIKSCELVLPDTVQALFNKSNLDANAICKDFQEFDRSTAFHFACRAIEKSDEKVAKHLVELFWKYAIQQSIKMHIRDSHGLTGLEYLRNNKNTSHWIVEFSEKYELYPLGKCTTMLLKSIDENDLELLKKTKLENAIDINDKMPGMNKSFLQDALENNEVFAMKVIKQSKYLKLDLNQKHEYTPLMISCDLALPQVVEELFKQKVDCNIVTDGIRQSAFHLACKSNAKQKKEVVDLFVFNAELLQIDLDAEDYFGKTGWDYYLELEIL